MSDIFINKKIWNTFSDEELNEYIDSVFNYYRSYGFPYFKLTQSEIVKVYNKMIEFDSSTLIKDDVIKQVMLGLNLVNYFFPHMWEVRTNKFKSPMDCFMDDENLLKAIRKRIRLGDNMSDAGLRKALSWTTGHHRVSNFRPTVAKYIYDQYGGDGNVLDFSAGFGGRLLGAISSSKVRQYTATDPSNLTYDGLCNMIDKLPGNDTTVILFNSAIEDLKLPNDTYDLIFSSPPYFNTEEYAYEDTQSFVRYKTKDEWKESFLEPLIKSSYDQLTTNGHFIINVADVKTYPSFESDTVNIATSVGFKLIKTYKMSLSSLMSSGFKYEPIFVFKK